MRLQLNLQANMAVYTPLHCAALDGRHDVVEVLQLVGRGASINAMDKDHDIYSIAQFRIDGSYWCIGQWFRCLLTA